MSGGGMDSYKSYYETIEKQLAERDAEIARLKQTAEVERAAAQKAKELYESLKEKYEPKPVVLTRSYHVLPDTNIQGYFTYKVVEGALGCGQLVLIFTDGKLTKAEIL